MSSPTTSGPGRLANPVPSPSDNKNDASGDLKGGISWRQAMGTVGLALAIPWMIGVPALIGWWLDKKFETSPLWFIVGLILGLLTTAVDIYQLLKRFGQFK